MRYIFYFLLLVCIHTGCNNSSHHEDNGKQAMKEIKLESVQRFSIAGMSQVEFIKSDANKIEINGTEQQLTDLKISTSGDLIKISSGGSDHENSKLITRIYTTNASDIDVAGCGNVTIGEVLQNTKAEVDVSGIGKVSATLNCETIKLSASGIGAVILSGHVKQGNLDITAVASLDTKKLQNENASVNTSAIGSHNF